MHVNIFDPLAEMKTETTQIHRHIKERRAGTATTRSKGTATMLDHNRRKQKSQTPTPSTKREPDFSIGQPWEERSCSGIRCRAGRAWQPIQQAEEIALAATAT